MDKLIWVLFALAVLAVSGLVGLHLGRFREAYTEMTGMMAGMMMGMLNGFLLGYCAAAAANSMFWGNLFGIVLGLATGVYFGRAGGLMGILDGAMGGVMGGSMGAMLAIMLVFPREGIWITAILLGLVYIAGMAGLVVLIEQSAPGHAALHRLLPMFTRAVATEAAEQAEWAEWSEETEERYAGAQPHSGPSSPSRSRKGRRLVDYYALLGVERDATSDEITGAYRDRLDDLGGRDSHIRERLERAYSTLTSDHRRGAYDRKLGADVSYTTSWSAPPTPNDAEARPPVALAAPPDARADCCPPPRQKRDRSTAVLEEPNLTKVEQPKNAVSPALPASRREAAAETATVRVNSSPASPPQREAHPLPARRSGSGRNSGVADPGARSTSNSPAPGTAGNQGTQGRGGLSRAAQSSRGKARSNSTDRGERLGHAREGSKGAGRHASQRQQVRYAGTKQQAQQHTVISLPLALGVAALLLLVALGWWILSMNGSAIRAGQVPNLTTNGAASNLEARAVVAPLGADGTQTLDVAVNGDTISYEPPVIKVKQGVPVRFNLSIKGRDPG